MFTPIKTYLNEALAELKKVAWPTRHTTIQHTIMVIGLSLGLALFLAAVDYLLNLGLERLLYQY